jgi:hypothetical protein
MNGVNTDVLVSDFHQAWRHYKESPGAISLIRLSESIQARGQTPAAEAALADAYETLFLADARFRRQDICCYFEHKLHLYTESPQLYYAWLEVARRLIKTGDSGFRNSIILWSFHNNRLQRTVKGGRPFTLFAPGAAELRREILPTLSNAELKYAIQFCLTSNTESVKTDDFIIDELKSFAVVNPGPTARLYCLYFAPSKLDDDRSTHDRWRAHVRELLINWWRLQTSPCHHSELEVPFQALARGSTNEELKEVFRRLDTIGD